MSLILEALRKSEAERRRGEVPKLHAERAPAAAATRATGTAWPWLALALVAAITLAWLARGAWSATPDSGASGRPGQTASDPEAGATAGARDPGAVPAAAAPPLSADRVPPTDAAPLADAQTPQRAGAGAEAIAATGDTAGVQPRVDPVRTPVRAVDADAADPGDGSTGARPPAVVAPPAPRVAAVPAPVSNATTMAPRTAPATASGTAADGTPRRLSDLSTAERLELPPLKMSMHLWDPSPARRFAIIDGARVNEGDRIGDAVVDEITANAVLLAWRGQQLQIPMR